MKIKAMALALACAAGLASAPAAQANELIIGAKVGLLDFDANGFDNTFTGGLQLGYEFLDLAVVDLAGELEITRSLSAGDAPGGDYDYSALGAFVSARSAGPIYVIGRIGFIDGDVDYSAGDDQSDSGVALGLGFGSSVGLRWELEMTTYDLNDSDATLFTFGLSF